jgi:hypothetical protein
MSATQIRYHRTREWQRAGLPASAGRRYRAAVSRGGAEVRGGAEQCRSLDSLRSLAMTAGPRSLGWQSSNRCHPERSRGIRTWPPHPRHQSPRSRGAEISSKHGTIRPFCRSDPRHPCSVVWDASNDVQIPRLAALARDDSGGSGRLAPAHPRTKKPPANRRFERESISRATGRI